MFQVTQKICVMDKTIAKAICYWISWQDQEGKRRSVLFSCIKKTSPRMHWSLPYYPTFKVEGQSLMLRDFNNFIKVYIATYDALQYTWKDHIDTICPEYTLMYSKKLQKSFQSCHYVGCSYFSDPHTYSCVCVLHPPTSHSSPTHVTALRCNKLLPTSSSRVQQTVGTKEHMWAHAHIWHV